MLLVSIFSFGQNNAQRYFKKEGFEKRNEARKTKALYFKSKQKANFRSDDSEKQQLDSLVDKWYNYETNEFENYSKYHYIRDSNGNYVVLYSAWNDETYQWENQEKDEYTFDDDGKLILEVYSEFYDGQWVYSYKNESTYNSKGNIDREIETGWNEEENLWEVDLKWEYTYDDNDNMIEVIHTSLNEDENLWGNVYRSLLTYDAEKNIIEYTSSKWTSATDGFEWIITSKSLFTYDINGRDSIIIDLTTSKNTTNEFINRYKWDCTYDSNGNNLTEIYSNWNEDENQWEYESKWEYTYDLAYTFNELIVPGYDFLEADPYYVVNKPIDNKLYYIEDGDWYLDGKENYHYSTVSSVSVLDTELGEFNVFPNPAADIVNLNLKNKSNVAIFELYDTQGKKLISKQIGNNDQINIKNLNSGVYIYNVNTNGNVQNGKLIKK
jgi:hypothetical protein